MIKHRTQFTSIVNRNDVRIGQALDEKTNIRTLNWFATGDVHWNLNWFRYSIRERHEQSSCAHKHWPNGTRYDTTDTVEVSIAIRRCLCQEIARSSHSQCTLHRRGRSDEEEEMTNLKIVTWKTIKFLCVPNVHTTHDVQIDNNWIIHFDFVFERIYSQRDRRWISVCLLLSPFRWSWTTMLLLRWRSIDKWKIFASIQSRASRQCIEIERLTFTFVCMRFE